MCSSASVASTAASPAQACAEGEMPGMHHSVHNVRDNTRSCTGGASTPMPMPSREPSRSASSQAKGEDMRMAWSCLKQVCVLAVLPSVSKSHGMQGKTHLQASGEQEARAGRHGPLPQQHASQEDNAIEGKALPCFALLAQEHTQLRQSLA